MSTTFRQKIYYTGEEIQFVNVAAADTSRAINVADFVKVGMNLASAGSADLVFKMKGSIGPDAPDFSSPSSPSNPWFYVDIAPLDAAGVVVDGDVGVSWTGVDATRGVEINTDTLDYVALSLATHTAGTLTCTALTATTNG